MKTFFKKNTLYKLGRLLASLALLLATYSVNSTCLFMTYQPEVPDQLKNIRKYESV